MQQPGVLCHDPADFQVLLTPLEQVRQTYDVTLDALDSLPLDYNKESSYLHC